MSEFLQVLHDDPVEESVKLKSWLTDAPKEIEIINTTLVGMGGIVLLLYLAALLPVLDMPPVTNGWAALVMGLAALVGIVVLSVMNFRVHKHVTSHAQLTQVLVNSLGQGFLSFGKDGICGPIYSQACLEMLEIMPAGCNIAEVLRVPSESQEDFRGWVEVLFDPTHALGFDDAVRFLPQTFAHSAGRNIALAYKPIRTPQDVLVNVVVIVTDRTEETEAQKLAEERQHFANMICKIFKERNQFVTTIGHVRDFIAEAGQGNITLQDMPSLMRQLHTLKAAVRHFDLVKLGTLVHEVESQIRNAPPENDGDLALVLATAHDAIAAEFSRVLLDVRELVGVEEERRGTVYEISEDDIYAFAASLKDTEKGRELLERYCADIASQPVRTCFLGFERELIELAQMMDKNLKPLQFTGGDVRVLARPMKDFFFSLTHISRNIIDHGIEPPVTRMARQKDAAGQIKVDVCAEEKGWLVITITDDGAGIDPSRLRQKLAATDPDGAWRFESDRQVIQRIFNFGISTRDGITAISGRGVGLEAVLNEVNRLGGSINVSSEIYVGTSFTIRLPYRMSL